MQELKKRLVAVNSELTSISNYINDKQDTNESFLPVIFQVT